MSSLFGGPFAFPGMVAVAVPSRAATCCFTLVTQLSFSAALSACWIKAAGRGATEHEVRCGLVVGISAGTATTEKGGKEEKKIPYCVPV